MRRRAVLLAGASVAGFALSSALKPTVRASEALTPIHLEQQIPAAFGGWRVDPSVRPVVPDPAVQAQLDLIYGQVLARTYVNGRGLRVMLSIAYGEDQGTDATAAHRPEFCYSAQGFAVKAIADTQLTFGQHRIAARRLLGRLGARFEPITYWVTLNDRAVLPGVRRKLEQIRLGLSGQIPDGMLVRTSTVGLELAPSFAAQDEFLLALYDTLSVDLKARYFGVPAAALT